MKIIIVILLSLMSLGCAANENNFSCSNEHKTNINEYNQLIASTKEKIVFQVEPPEVEFYIYKDSYGSVLLTFKVDDKGSAQNIAVKSECPRRVLAKYSKDTLKKYRFQKADSGAEYLGAIVITF